MRTAQGHPLTGRFKGSSRSKGTLAVQRSVGDELAGTSLDVRVGAGAQGRREAAPDAVVVGELGEVLMGEVSSRCSCCAASRRRISACWR